MRISKPFPLNPLLELEVETSDEDLLRFFEIKFADLYPSSTQVSNSRLKVRIQEVPCIDIASPQVIRKIGIPELCLFDEKTFVIVRDKKRIKIPFLEIGQASELDITFETGFPVEWLRRYLDGLVAFHLIGKGASLYHAACVRRGECEIIIPAWRGTGKTTLALYLLEDRSSTYKAEDQFVLKGTGESYAYTDACHIDFKHMDQFPAIKRKCRSLDFALRTAVVRTVLPLIPPRGRVLTIAHRGLLKVLAPKVFIKLRDCIPDLQISTRQPARRIVLQLIAQRDVVEPVIEPIDVGTLVRRTVGGMQYEREDIYIMYCAFVYATGRRNCVIDNAVERETQILCKALERAACYEVRIGDNWPENFGNITRFLQKMFVEGEVR